MKLGYCVVEVNAGNNFVYVWIKANKLANKVSNNLKNIFKSTAE